MSKVQVPIQNYLYPSIFMNMLQQKPPPPHVKKLFGRIVHVELWNGINHHDNTSMAG